MQIQNRRAVVLAIATLVCAGCAMLSPKVGALRREESNDRDGELESIRGAGVVRRGADLVAGSMPGVERRSLLRVPGNWREDSLLGGAILLRAASDDGLCERPWPNQFRS